MYIYIYTLYTILYYTHICIFFLKRASLTLRWRRFEVCLGKASKNPRMRVFWSMIPCSDCLCLVLWCLYDVSFNFCFQEQTYHIYDSSIFDSLPENYLQFPRIHQLKQPFFFREDKVESAPVNLKKGVPFEEAEVNRRGRVACGKTAPAWWNADHLATLLDFKLSLKKPLQKMMLGRRSGFLLGAIGKNFRGFLGSGREAACCWRWSLFGVIEKKTFCTQKIGDNAAGTTGQMLKTVSPMELETGSLQ